MVWGIYTSSIFTRWQHSAIHSDFSSNVVLEKWNRDFSLSLKFRRRPHSTSSHELSVPRTRLSTYSDRAFSVAAVRIWNSLPQRITSAPSLPIFCSRLKRFTDTLIALTYLLTVVAQGVLQNWNI